MKDKKGDEIRVKGKHGTHWNYMEDLHARVGNETIGWVSRKGQICKVDNLIDFSGAYKTPSAF